MCCDRNWECVPKDSQLPTIWFNFWFQHGIVGSHLLIKFLRQKTRKRTHTHTTLTDIHFLLMSPVSCDEILSPNEQVLAPYLQHPVLQTTLLAGCLISAWESLSLSLCVAYRLRNWFRISPYQRMFLNVVRQCFPPRSIEIGYCMRQFKPLHGFGLPTYSCPKEVAISRLAKSCAKTTNPWLWHANSQFQQCQHEQLLNM